MNLTDKFGVASYGVSPQLSMLSEALSKIDVVATQSATAIPHPDVSQNALPMILETASGLFKCL